MTDDERAIRDLRAPDLSRKQLLATVVRLLDKTLIRVGNDEYVRENKSFGLTTLRRRHVKVQGDTLRFEFRGKSGVDHAIALDDPRLFQPAFQGGTRQQQVFTVFDQPTIITWQQGILLIGKVAGFDQQQQRGVP